MGLVAQLEERVVSIGKVVGSNPTGSIYNFITKYIELIYFVIVQ